MMRLPRFRYATPKSAEEAVSILRGEGERASLVAGGTDLYPNMKRRQVTPETVVSLRGIPALRGFEWKSDGSVRIGPGETLRAVERDARLKEEMPALHEAVHSISTPILRNMGTIGGNLCLDTRCFYLNQNEEWRRAVHNCLKCGGDTCWTAPGGDKCWAVNSSDSVPAMIALGASLRFVGPEGPRAVSAEDFFATVEDGREWLGKRREEILTDIEIPAQSGARSTYLKLRKRGSFDFPVLGVAARIVTGGDGKVKEAAVVLNAVGPAPIRCKEAEQALLNYPLGEETIREASLLAPRAAKPLLNTDFLSSYRKKMVRVFVQRALHSLIS